MKVELTASPKFRFEVTHGLVVELIELSKRHYDNECKMASGRIGRPLFSGSSTNHPKNGLLVQWLDRFELNADENDTENVWATWGELDLVSKICEFPPNNGEFDDWRRSRAFSRSIGRMLDVARPKIETEWIERFDV